MMPTGVHGRGAAFPSTRHPRLNGCSPSTSFRGSTRDSRANSSSPVGCWTRYPVHAGSELSSSTMASTSDWPAPVGRSYRMLAMPTSAQSLCLALTYHRVPGSSPTRMVPRPGTMPRSASAAIRTLSSSLMVARVALPSRVRAVMPGIFPQAESGPTRAAASRAKLHARLYGGRGADPVVGNGVQGHPPSGAHDAPEGYKDLVPIARGGFANVYRARDTRFDRTVALKILRSDSLNDRQLRRFRAECLATGRVSSHPNIVTVYDAGTTRGNRPWLAMEYCSGGSLAHKLAVQGPLPVADVISIGARLCSALSAAHQAGILHRDVKPHNVLLTSYGEPALADFGIASVVIEDDTVTETAAYTVVHAAPEILEGRSGTAAADIYSLGSTLYALLAGHAPFATEAGIGLGPLVTRILRNDLPAIDRPGVPPDLEKLLRSCMAAEPCNRPASAAELGAALTALGRRLASPEVRETALPQVRL